jgi:hypothetical protein|nr:MAG TPA: minor tail protein [Caudoviricetes sp.]
MSIKITDLIDPNEIEKIKQLDTELTKVYEDYTKIAKDLAKGLEINVSCVGDIDRLEKLLVEKGKEAASTQQKLTQIMGEQSKVLANTTNTASRYLMEQERVNKTQREAYTEHDKVKRLLEQFHDTYDGQLQRLVKIKQELEQNNKAQKENEKALSAGKVTMDQYTAKQAELIAQHRSLTQEKRTLTQIMTAEEKAAQSDETSYVHMSQQLELLKKAYKDLAEEGRNSDFGKEVEESIQNLDAHLKDVAADMGEFQRNVGNYAIAGQKGVVTTDSVVAAMNQEARTTQDLIDQTKILEEAKLMLNKEDANYQSTLDSLNAKLEENKRKLTDVSDIINKDATSVAEAEAQNKRLQEALKRVDLTSDDAQKKIKELNDKIAANTAIIKENTPAIQDQTKATEQQAKANEDLAGNMLNLLGLNTQFGSSLKGLEGAGTGDVLDGLNTKVKAFGKTLMGLLSNPWVLSFLGIAGMVAGFKWWYEYNKGMIEASRLTQNFTGLTGDAADKITADTQAIADHMGKSFDDTIGAANTLVQQFGLSWEEALTKIEDGIEAGADMNGRLIENINQFAPALRDAGVSADELVAILAETRNGIFDEKGVQEIIKGGTQLRAMTKDVAESLDACGISSKQMQKDLKEGNITMLDAVQQVSAKLKELPENSQEAGQIMKSVFGRTAAEGGTLLIQSIADVNTNLDVAKDRMGKLGKVNREQLTAQKELNETLAAVFKMSGTRFEEMTTQAKTYVTQGLTSIIKRCVDVYNWFVDLYNSSEKFRTNVENAGATFKILWSVVKNVCKAIAEQFKGLGKIVEGVFTISPTKIAEGIETMGAGFKNAIVGVADDYMDAVKKAIDNVEHKKLNTLTLHLEPEVSTDKTPESNLGDTDKKQDDIESEAERKARERAAKEAEKRAKEELKRINELEEAKISVMADGHEKELAMIRLNYKKKMDEIRGNSETENSLRIQLAEQCQNEIAECERKYQTELSKINLENRLASVKEGSKEELTLKLAMLEANRAAELRAAEKNGADILLINAKFNKERADMEEAYASEEVNRIEKKYADEQAIADNAYIHQMNVLKKNYASEMELARGNADKQAKIKAKFEADQAELTQYYAQTTAQASIDMLEEVLQTENMSADERLKYEQELAKAKINLEQVMSDAAIEKIDKITEADDKANEKRKASVRDWMQVAADSLNAINGLVSTVYDAKISRIEEEQEANSTAGEAEIERITELVDKKAITEEQGEARKRAAEDRTAKKNEELEKKKQQLKYKQAVWDKANSVAQAGISTALAIMNMMKSAPWPVNIAMSAIAGAMGAVQVATILATPIPKYAKGTDRHKGGPAIVGDGGMPELVIFGGKSWVTPDTPTLVDLPAGAMVIPELPNSFDVLCPAPVAPDGVNTPVIVNNDYSALQREVSALGFLIRQQTKQQKQIASDIAFQQYISSKI